MQKYFVANKNVDVNWDLKTRDSGTSKPTLITTTLSQINLRRHLKTAPNKNRDSTIFKQI